MEINGVIVCVTVRSFCMCTAVRGLYIVACMCMCAHRIPVALKISSVCVHLVLDRLVVSFCVNILAITSFMLSKYSTKPRLVSDFLCYYSAVGNRVKMRKRIFAKNDFFCYLMCFSLIA